MIVKCVKITKCRDPMRWYNKHVGEVWNVIDDCGTEYRCRASDGFLNFILKEDCEPYIFDEVVEDLKNDME